MATKESIDWSECSLVEVKAGVQSGAPVLLGNEPGAGHVREDLTSRPVKFWPVYSYLIVYDPEAKPVQVIRVLHGMRDVEEILN